MAAEVTTPTSRRVLGTKSTNSFLSAGRKNVETGKAGLKHPLPSPQHAGTSRTTKYPKTGEKRRREEMQEQDEESEDRQTWGSPPITRAACSPLQGAHLASTLEPSDSSQASALLSQPLSLLSDIEPVSPRADQETVEESTGSNSLTSRNTTSTLQTSFESSQGVSVEEQFEISEEMSQNALDKIHAVRFSQSQQHTSQLVPPIRPSLLAEASQESFGMSNFIEYEKDERGGDDEDVEMAEPGSKRDRLKNIPLASSPGSAAVKAEIENSAGVVDTVEGSKPSMAEAAQMLRTRLQLALYKVRTHQTRTPFSRLRVPTRHSQSPPRSRVQATPHRSSSPDLPPLRSTRAVKSSRAWSITPPIPTNVNSPESKLAAARARIANVRKPRVKSLGDLPLPTLQPGPFSARYVEIPDGEILGGKTGEDSSTTRKDSDREDEDKDTQHIPSSPPMVPSATHDRSARVAAALPATPAGEKVLASVSLTSSVVKGEAANGLLNLSRSFENS